MPILALNFKNTIEDTKQTLYTSPSTGSGTRIDSFTATNNGTINSSYECYIETSAITDIPTIPMRIVIWGDLDLGIGLVNQTIPPGSSIRVSTSSLGNIAFTASGAELP